MHHLTYDFSGITIKENFLASELMGLFFRISELDKLNITFTHTFID